MKKILMTCHALKAAQHTALANIQKITVIFSFGTLSAHCYKTSKVIILIISCAWKGHTYSFM